MKRELDNLDVSKNKFYFTVTETIQAQSQCANLGLIVEQHPDIKDAVELKAICTGTIAHKNIQEWKSRLRGTILTKINGKTVTCKEDIDRITRDERLEGKRRVALEFGSLTEFAINGNGVPTLQMDQLNVIAHHLNAINMNEENHYLKDDTYAEFWGGNKKEDYAWPDPIDQLNISKLTRNKILNNESQDVIDKFMES